MPEVYINAIAKFLPNEPVPNGDMEEYLGYIGGKKSRSKEIILRSNGIKTRYYALDRNGKPTHTNAQLTAQAIRNLVSDSFSIADIELLSSGTTTADQLLPSHAAMVHGLLEGAKPIEVNSFVSSCCSGMNAFKYGYFSVLSGNTRNAVTTGSERVSSWMTSKNFEEEDKKLEQLEDQPLLAFEKDFLRWMLSDGAAAVHMSDTPNKNKISLKIEWIDFVSFANQAEPCMYAGAEKISGSLKGWADYAPAEWLDRSVFSIKQDVKLLDRNITSLGSIAFNDSLKKHNLKASEIDYYLPHISSMYFADKVYAEMEKSGNIVPKEKWFLNLTKVGNVGAASIFLALEELMNTAPLKKGQKIFLKVPESARFSYAHALLTVC